MSPRRLLLVLLLIAAAYAAGAAGLSRIRPIDGDEGYYAAASRLVHEGATPYQDFFYPQAPYLPYLYAPAYGAAGSSLVQMRILSVVLLVIGLAAWLALLRARCADRPLLAVAGALLVALNPDLLSWGVTVKTYAATNAAVAVSLLAVDRGFASRKPWPFLVAGVVAGLAVGVRAMYLPWAVSLVVVLAWFHFRRPDRGVTLASVGAAALGLVLGLAPVLPFALRDFARFRFNNLDYHELRFSPLERAGEEAPPRLLASFAEFGETLLHNPSLVLLLALAVVGVLAARRAAREKTDGGLGPVARVAGVGAAVVLVTGLLPDPVHAQYFTSPLVPLLAPVAVLGLADLARRFNRPAVIAALVVVVCGGLGAYELQVRKTGMHWEEVWSVEHLADVTANIERLTEPGDKVLAFWSGYVFESGRDFVPGMENHFALGVSEQMDLQRKIDYHVAGKELLLQAILQRLPRVIVLGGWMHEVNTSLDQEHLPVILQELDANYEIAWMRGETKILVRR